MTEKIRATLTLRNNRLLKLREATGMTQVEMAKYIDIQAYRYQWAEQLKPISFDEMEKIAIAFDKPVEWIFSEDIQRVRKNKFTKEVSIKELKLIYSHRETIRLAHQRENGDPSNTLEARDYRFFVNKATSTLTERERDIVEKRFGINGQPLLTLKEIGKKYGVGQERIRQIEAKAIRKIRHPSSAMEIMKNFYPEEYEAKLQEI